MDISGCAPNLLVEWIYFPSALGTSSEGKFEEHWTNGIIWNMTFLIDFQIKTFQIKVSNPQQLEDLGLSQMLEIL